MAKDASDFELELLKQLRQDAYNLKQCFTQYTFHSLAFSAAVIGLALRFYDELQYAGLVGIPLTLLFLTVATIGTHKYTGANRIAGYELHLQRVARYPAEGCAGWHPLMRTLGWEECLRAWRVFQATTFEFIYGDGDLRKIDPKEALRSRIRRKVIRLVKFWEVEQQNAKLYRRNGTLLPLINPKKDEWWFSTRSHLKEGMKYYPGSYLQTLLNMIYLASSLSMIFTFVACYKLLQLDDPTVGYISTAGSIVFSYWAVARFTHTYARRKVLEEGLLSVNSCAVLWQVIACAHFWALSDLANRSKGKFVSYQNYSETIGMKAIEFCEQIDTLYTWYQSVPINRIAALVPPPVANDA